MKRRILFFVLILGLIAGGLVVQRSNIVYAAKVPDSTYLVEGKYSISSKKVVIKCEMTNMYDNTDSKILEKKKRTFKITSKSKIMDSASETVYKGKKRSAMIKKMNKKHFRFFIDIKKGKVKSIYVDVE